MPETDHIAAVIPAFQPDADRLLRMLAALAPQCGRIYVADNGGAHLIVAEASKSFGVPIEVLGEGENIGVAAAQNLGIRRALETAADAILFMDQDSVPDSQMVGQLIGALGRLKASGQKVAACGPRYHEPGSPSLSSFVRAGRFRLSHVLPPPRETTVPCDFLISSGMLVPSETLRVVGAMEEDLFIDHVDTEWCFRAKRAGYACFGVGCARMEHELGRSRKKIWLGRWRQVPEHPPERLYFLARNTLWLAQRPYIPFACKQHLLTRLAGLAFFAVLADQNRPQRMAHLLRGIREGFSPAPSMRCRGALDENL